ncbi:hypothetical protein F5878DRAFT_728546 [Lentinula raphanica]|uniref:Uncharacterized protein n=1 Tax=Lentinula raphanica TaxID=153919 RepID=A0AA38P076_9AGAR|nr:hypothetical protein F5878DRAFT_728546 [Lentinula raphanica]
MYDKETRNPCPHQTLALNHNSSIEKGKSSPVALESHQDVHNIDEDEIEEVGSTDADYETESESSRTEGNGSPERSHSFTQRTGEDSQDEGQNFRSNSEQFEHRPLTHQPAQARSWYEFDLAVVAALVSPIGQWLTGGDHIKNLLLVMLLVFYLHQIIEIPWTLYYNARPRVKPHSTRLPAADDFHARRATSELRFLEFFFLSFAIVSPFFVKEAVSDDIVEMKQQLEELQGRMQEMQQSMTKLKKKLVKETNEAFDYVDEQVEPVEKMVQQHEKALEYVLQLRASLLNSRPSKSTSPKSLSPNASPSFSLKPLHPANHSGSSSPILTKLETIHEAIYEGMESKPSRPKSIDTVKINTPKSIYVKSHSSKTRTPFPPMVLRPFVLLISLMTLPVLILFHALYAVTFPFRWCLRVFLRAMGMENVALQFQDVFSTSFRANAFTNVNR